MKYFDSARFVLPLSRCPSFFRGRVPGSELLQCRFTCIAGHPRLSLSHSRFLPHRAERCGGSQRRLNKKRTFNISIWTIAAFSALRIVLQCRLLLLHTAEYVGHTLRLLKRATREELMVLDAQQAGVSEGTRRGLILMVPGNLRCWGARTAPPLAEGPGWGKATML